MFVSLRLPLADGGDLGDGQPSGSFSTRDGLTGAPRDESGGPRGSGRSPRSSERGPNREDLNPKDSQEVNPIMSIY